MRLLHTADLHLGRSFNGLSLEEDHAAILEQVFDALRDGGADVLVVAGDLFDRAAPPGSAVRQFNDFLRRVVLDTGAAVVLIAGNHDSGDRVEAMSLFTDPARALVRGSLRGTEPALVLRDAHGPVAITALPFGYEHAAREAFGRDDIDSPADVLAAQMAAARAAVPAGARRVVVAHAFVTGAQVGAAERPLTRAGGLETVGAEVFDGAHYVALGHLHRPQAVGAPHIRYSGAPLAYGFDEAGAEKSLSLVEIGAGGAVTVEAVPLRPLRDVRVLTGSHADLLRAAPCADIVKAVLSDTSPVIDAMKRLREVFPNACELTYARSARAPETKAQGGPASPLADPLGVLDGFAQTVRDAPLSEAERGVAADALARLRAQGAA